MDDTKPLYIFLHPNEYRRMRAADQIYAQNGEWMCFGGVARIIQPLGSPALMCDEFDPALGSPTPPAQS